MDLTVAVTLAVVVALVAACRSTWSPCGLSMLSTLTPLAEAGRGHRWGRTAAIFIAGAALGGAGLGVVAAFGAAVVLLVDLDDAVVGLLLAAAAVVAVAFDLRVARPELPHLRRQVDERWIGRYRTWVYAGGFGVQIGFGLATYIMTAAVYLTVVAAAATGRPEAAFAIGVVFGTARGMAILCAARLSNPQVLMRFHERFDALGEPVRRATVGVVVVVGLAWAFLADGVAALGAVGVAFGVVFGLGVMVSRRRDRGRGRNESRRGVASQAGARRARPQTFAS